MFTNFLDCDHGRTNGWDRKKENAFGSQQPDPTLKLIISLASFFLHLSSCSQRSVWGDVGVICPDLATSRGSKQSTTPHRNQSYPWRSCGRGEWLGKRRHSNANKSLHL